MLGDIINFANVAATTKLISANFDFDVFEQSTKHAANISCYTVFLGGRFRNMLEIDKLRLELRAYDNILELMCSSCRLLDI